MRIFSSGKIHKLLKNSKFQFWAIFLVLILIRFLPFFQGKTLVFGDNYSLLVPGKIFTAQWLREGVLPLWNPYIFSGIPWIGDTTQSVFYPSSLLFTVFSPAAALNLTVILHLLLAYGGMYTLAKHWLKDHAWALVAGVLWMFSTQMTGSINNLATVQSLAWFPLIAYFGLRLVREKRFQGWFAGAILLQFLGGYPQHVLYSILLAVLLSGFREWKKLRLSKWLKAWSITAVFTIGFSAVAWVPFVDFLLRSTRVLQTEAQALVGSLHPATFIKFVLPYFFDNPAHGLKWGPAWNGQPNVGIYVTWLGWLAVGSSLLVKTKKLKREFRFFAVVTALTLLFSFGQYLPGFSLIQKIMPLFRVARYPSMMMIISNTVLVLWTVRALQNWSLKKQQQRWLMILGSGVLVVGFVGWWVHNNLFMTLWEMVDSFASSSLSQSAFHTAERDSIIMFEIVRNIVFNSIFFIAALYIFMQKKLKNRVFWLALVIGAEMACNTHGQFFFAPKNIYEVNSQTTQELQQAIGIKPTAFEHRLLTRNSNQPYTDYGSYWEALVVREPFSDSFVDAEGLQTFDHTINLRDGQTPDWNMVHRLPVVHGYTTLLPRDYAQLWNTSAEPRINFIDYLDPANPLLDDWAVRYYLVDTWFKIEEDLSEFPQVANLDRWQLLERPDAKARIRFSDDTPAELIDFTETPNSLSFTINNSNNQPSLLVADRFDPDWKLTINGQEQQLKNYQGMRLVEIEPGMNTIQMWYAPQWLYVGAGITLASMVGYSLLRGKK